MAKTGSGSENLITKTPRAVVKKTFGTFAGVFTPTTLTILGVIMYIRQPWVVGNAGIVGAMLILLLSVAITTTIALSISSIATNVKIGAGGAFSVISQSLGLEIGGSIGIPFYIAQAIAVAMYIFGFREGLQTLLPVHYPREIRSSYKLIESIIYPKGSIKLLTLKHQDAAEEKRLKEFIPTVIKKFEELNIPISQTSIDNKNYNDATNISMQALNAAFFKPNTILITADANSKDFSAYQSLIDDVRKNSYGLIVYVPFGTASLAIQKNVTLWVNELPEKWETSFDLGGNDLAVLCAIQICRNWSGYIKINACDKVNITSENKIRFQDMIRLPGNTEVNLLAGCITENIENELTSDLNIFSISAVADFKEMTSLVEKARISAIFCLDSEFENALV